MMPVSTLYLICVPIALIAVTILVLFLRRSATSIGANLTWRDLLRVQLQTAWFILLWPVVALAIWAVTGFGMGSNVSYASGSGAVILSLTCYPLLMGGCYFASWCLWLR